MYMDFSHRTGEVKPRVVIAPHVERIPTMKTVATKPVDSQRVPYLVKLE